MSDDIDPRLLPGSNNPPEPLKTAQELSDDLTMSFQDLLTRQQELLDGATRFPAIDDDETSGKAAGFLTQLTAFNKLVEAKRVDRKAPYLAAERVIDGFFAQITAPIVKAFREKNAMQTAFGDAKAARIRRAAEEQRRLEQAEADRKRREAEKAEAERQRAAREATRAKDDEARAAAQQRQREADARAEEARKAAADSQAKADEQAKTANASTAELSRTQGEFAKMSVRTTFDYEVVDITKVPAEYLMENARVIRAAIAGKNGKRDIPGLRIFESRAAVNR